MSPPNKAPARPGFDEIRREAETRRKAFDEAPGPKIHIGMATCGLASGALATKDAFEQELFSYTFTVSTTAIVAEEMGFAEDTGETDDE